MFALRSALARIPDKTGWTRSITTGCSASTLRQKSALTQVPAKTWWTRSITTRAQGIDVGKIQEDIKPKIEIVNDVLKLKMPIAQIATTSQIDSATITEPSCNDPLPDFVVDGMTEEEQIAQAKLIMKALMSVPTDPTDQPPKSEWISHIVKLRKLITGSHAERIIQTFESNKPFISWYAEFFAKTKGDDEQLFNDLIVIGTSLALSSKTMKVFHEYQLFEAINNKLTPECSIQTLENFVCFAGNIAKDWTSREAILNDPSMFDNLIELYLSRFKELSLTAQSEFFNMLSNFMPSRSLGRKMFIYQLLIEGISSRSLKQMRKVFRNYQQHKEKNEVEKEGKEQEEDKEEEDFQLSPFQLASLSKILNIILRQMEIRYDFRYIDKRFTEIAVNNEQFLYTIESILTVDYGETPPAYDEGVKYRALQIFKHIIECSYSEQLMRPRFIKALIDVYNMYHSLGTEVVEILSIVMEDKLAMRAMSGLEREVLSVIENAIGVKYGNIISAFYKEQQIEALNIILKVFKKQPHYTIMIEGVKDIIKRGILPYHNMKPLLRELAVENNNIDVLSIIDGMDYPSQTEHEIELNQAMTKGEIKAKVEMIKSFLEQKFPIPSIAKAARITESEVEEIAAGRNPFGVSATSDESDAKLDDK